MNFNFPQDELDQAIANAGNSPRVASRPDYVSPVERFAEGCPKCRGTGNWRPGYPCFACKGKGRVEFKTSATARASAKTSRDARKAKNGQEAIAAFATDHPAIWQWLDGNTFGFAVSLRESIARYGSLTQGQMEAAQRCIEKRKVSIAARTEAIAAGPAIDTTKLETAFKVAMGNGLLRPKLRIAGFSFSPAPASGRNAGAIYVKRNGEYLGKVQSGRFAAFGCDEATKASVIAIAGDPATAAIAHGIKTKNCSCCGIALTDPVSVARGIGPICATKYGF